MRTVKLTEEQAVELRKIRRKQDAHDNLVLETFRALTALKAELTEDFWELVKDYADLKDSELCNISYNSVTRTVTIFEENPEAYTEGIND